MKRNLLTAALFLSLPLTAHAKVGVVGLEGDAGTSRAAQLATQALRKAVRGLGMSLGPTKSLAEIKLVFGCDREQPTCMAQAARTMGVTQLVWGHVRRRGGVFIFSLRALNVARPNTILKASYRVPAASLTARYLATVAPGWVQKLLGVTTTGHLVISANPTGAVVAVDGKEVGPVGASGSLTLELPPGRHTVLVRKEGYRPARKRVRITLGRETRVHFQLNPLPRPRPAETRPAARVVKVEPEEVESSILETKPTQQPTVHEKKRSNQKLWWQVAFYTAAGLAAASFAVGAGFGIAMKHREDDVASYARDHGATADPEQGNDETHPCRSPVWSGMEDYCAEGRKLATMANVFYGLGAAFAVGAGVLSYFAFFKHYKQESQEAEPAGAESAASRLRVLPAVGPKAATVSVELSF